MQARFLLFPWPAYYLVKEIMNTLTLLLEKVSDSTKEGDHQYETLMSLNTKGDDTLLIKLISSQPVPKNAQFLFVLGSLKVGKDISDVLLFAQEFSVVLKTPTWNNNPWGDKLGLLNPVNWAILSNVNLGANAETKFVNDTQVTNANVATRCINSILSGDLETEPTWMRLAFWGGHSKRAKDLLKGQLLKYVTGPISFQFWENLNGDTQLSVQINVRSFIKGPSSIPSDQAPEPPATEFPDYSINPANLVNQEILVDSAHPISSDHNLEVIIDEIPY
jgi:single-stranded DNA-binding protein